MPIQNRPTVEEAKQFEKYVRKWQQLLSLGDWRIERSSKIAKNAMADVAFDAPARLATYRLGDWGGEPITPESLEKTAIHELLHVRLHDLIATAQNKEATEEQLEAAEHAVVNVLERLLAGEKEE